VVLSPLLQLKGLMSLNVQDVRGFDFDEQPFVRQHLHGRHYDALQQ
jgi:hypothetical protein